MTEPYVLKKDRYWEGKCDHCGEPMKLTWSYHKERLRKSKTGKLYCTRQCSNDGMKARMIETGRAK